MRRPNAVLLALLLLRRLRLLAGLVVAGAAAAAAAAGILALTGNGHPAGIAVNLARRSWLASAAFPEPAVATAAAVCIALLPWLQPGWRRAAWIALLAAGAARLLTATALPMELVIAAGTAILAAFGVRWAAGKPDRRLGTGGGL